MNLNVSTLTSFKRSGKPVLIQNLGPGALYVSLANTVDASSGIQLDVFDAIEMPAATHGYVYLVSASTSDVRLLGGADVGVQGPVPPPPQITLSNLLSYSTQGSIGIVVSLEQASASDVTVNFTTAATTTADPDFSGSFGPTSVTIPAGSLNQVFSPIVQSTFAGDFTFPYDVDWTATSADADYNGQSGSHVGPQFVSAGPNVLVEFPPGLVEAGTYDGKVSFPVATTDDIVITSGVVGGVSAGPGAADPDALLVDTRVSITNLPHTIPSGTVGTYTIPNLWTVADDGTDQVSIYDWVWVQLNATSTDQHVVDGILHAERTGLADNPVLVVDWFGSGIVPASMNYFSGVPGIGSTIVDGFALGYTPGNDVTVNLTSDNPDVTISPTSLTFTTGNFSTEQNLTFTAGTADDPLEATITATVDASSLDTSRVGHLDKFVVYFES